MTRLTYLLTLAWFLSFGSFAAAQETTEQTASEETATEETAAQEAEGENDNGLDLGEEVVEEPTYIRETHGDWEIKCFRDGNDDVEDLCQMFQLLKEDAGNPVAEFSIFKLPSGGQAVAGATVVVPLGTLLGEELKISVDGGRAKSYGYSFCTVVGCFARIGFTAQDIASFKAGNEANLVIVPAQAPDQKVTIKASLSGFTAAFDNASVLNQ